MRVAAIGGVRLDTSLTFSQINYNLIRHVRTHYVILSVRTLLGEPKVQFDNVCEANLGRSVAECRIFAAKAATTNLDGNFLCFKKSPNKYVISCSFVAKILRIVNPIHPLSLICSE